MERNDLPHIERPVSELLGPGRLMSPPRSCRTRIKGVHGKRPTWRLKLAYADAADAQKEAARSDSTAYECGNCGFWHTGNEKVRND